MNLKNTSLTAVIGGAFLLSSAAFGQSAAFLQHDGPVTIPEGTFQCSADALIDQPLDQFDTARTSDVAAGFVVADNFTSGGLGGFVPAGEADSITAWAIQAAFTAGVGFTAGCNNDGADFVVTSWTDDGGEPGAVIDTQVVVPTITDTGITFAFTTIFEVGLDLSPALDLDNAGWVSIQREATTPPAGADGCFFLWVDNELGSIGDNFSVQINTDTGDVTSNGTDQSICLEGTGTVEGPDIPADAVIGLNFIGTVAGISGSAAWASDMRLDVEGPSGSAVAIGGFSTPGPIDWDFDGSGSTNDGTYESFHGTVFLPGTQANGEWSVSFENNWTTGTVTQTWTDTVVTLLLGDGTEIPLELDDAAYAPGASLTFLFDVEVEGEGPPELPESTPVPVNSAWALGLMVLLLAGLGLIVIRRMG